VFATAIHFHPRLIFASNAIAYQSGAYYWTLLNGKLLAFRANIRIAWKGMAVGNTLAYYDVATITPVKVLLEQAQGGSV
jgi:hypothetical protein